MPTITDIDTSQSDFQEGSLTNVEADAGGYLRLLYSPNVVPDGDFSEQTLQVPYSTVLNGTLSIVTGGKYGTYCLRHEATGDDSFTDNYQGLDNSLASAAEGETWTASIDVKGAVGGESVELFLFSLDSTGNFIQAPNTNFNASTDWQRFSITATMPAGTVGIATRVDNNVAGNVVYWDGWQVEKLSSATPFHEGNYVYDGYRLSPQLDLSAVGMVESSLVSWTQTLNGGTITIETRVSTDNGATWSAWKPCTNGGSIPDLPYGTDVSTALLECRQSLSTSDPTVTPRLESITVEVGGEFGRFFAFPF